MENIYLAAAATASLESTDGTNTKTNEIGYTTNITTAPVVSQKQKMENIL
jgi:hypothetical protein